MTAPTEAQRRAALAKRVDLRELRVWNRRTRAAREAYWDESANLCAYDDCPRGREIGDDVCAEHRYMRDVNAAKVRRHRARRKGEAA